MIAAGGVRLKRSHASSASHSLLTCSFAAVEVKAELTLMVICFASIRS